MKRDQSLCECACGHQVSASADRIKLGLEICPRCGNVIRSPGGKAGAPSLADTQTINVRDMARMAQEGIDLEASGEWDTSACESPAPPPNEEDSK